MKKIDKLILGSFIGPFILTFLVVVFILLMQHMLKYFEDLVGKDLGWDVLGQLLFYFAVFMSPVALPLAVLLSSLITFGNLGEHFELTAIKSSGISLLRALQPIFIFVLLLTGIAFYINNNLVPKAALEAYSLLYDIKQKKPALDIREGAFYMGIPDISIKVTKKFRDDAAALKGVVIYDHRKNEGNKQVTVADSGRMTTILHERYLKLELFNGYNYNEGTSTEHEMAGQRRNRSRNESLSRTQFKRTQMIFDLSSFNLERTDKKWFQGNRIMRNLYELEGDIDSLKTDILAQRYEHFTSRPVQFVYFRRDEPVHLPAELVAYRLRQDTVAKEYYDRYNTGASTPPTSTPQSNPVKPPQVAMPTTAAKPIPSNPQDHDVSAQAQSTSKVKQLQTKKRIAEMERRRTEAQKRHAALAQKNLKKKAIESKPVVTPAPVVKRKPVNQDSLIAARIDSVFNMPVTLDNYQNAANSARQAKSVMESNNTNVETTESELRIFQIQWHKILANSLACVAMFLIGAPLGAIIKKGGLGVPFLVSILFFILFYVMNLMGEKWAKAGSVGVTSGVWGADFILFIVGLLFLRQARADARLFDADSYLVVFDRIKRRWFTKPTPVKAG